ncbi:MAG: antitoxin VapB family protein [Nanoarchaeota archaeon]
MTKVISLSNDAYARLKSQKHEGESFSDVVVRSFPSKKRLADLFGCLADSADEWKEIEKKIYEDRKKFKLREVNFDDLPGH